MVYVDNTSRADKEGREGERVSKPYPWFRLWGELWRDGEYRAMTLEQRAVYVALLCYASEQTVRGSFPDQPAAMADAVADGDKALYQSVVDYCSSRWKSQDEQFHLVLDAGYWYFSQWNKRQEQAPTASRAAVRERVAAHRARQRNALQEPDTQEGEPSNALQDALQTSAPYAHTRVSARARRDKVSTKASSNGFENTDTFTTSAASASDASRSIHAREEDQVLALLQMQSTAQRLSDIKRVIAQHPHLAPLAVARDFMEWQEREEAKDARGEDAVTYRDRVRGWTRQMVRRSERANTKFLRDAQETPTAPPDTGNPVWDRVLHVLRWRADHKCLGRALDARDFDEFRLREQRNGSITLETPFDVEWTERMWGDNVRDAAREAGYELAVQFVTQEGA